MIVLIGRLIMNDKLERMSKEVAVVCFMIFSWRGEDHRKSQDNWS
jgi:hypothetical protein